MALMSTLDVVVVIMMRYTGYIYFFKCIYLCIIYQCECISQLSSLMKLYIIPLSI